MSQNPEPCTNAAPSLSEPHLRFQEASALTRELLERLQHTVRRRVLRHCERHSPRLTLPETPSARPPQPEAAEPQTPDAAPSRSSPWAALLARIYEVFPLICPTCQKPLTFIAFLTDPEPISQILVHMGKPTSPPLLHPARGPPQAELAMRLAGAESDEAAQESFPDDLNQSPTFDPSEPEPIPEDDFDQSWEA